VPDGTSNITPRSENYQPIRYNKKKNANLRHRLRTSDLRRAKLRHLQVANTTKKLKTDEPVRGRPLESNYEFIKQSGRLLQIRGTLKSLASGGGT